MNTFNKVARAFQMFFAASMAAVAILFLLVNKASAVPVSVILIMLGISVLAGAAQVLLLDTEREYKKSLALRSLIFYTLITTCITGTAIFLRWIKTVPQGALLVGVITVVFVVQWVFQYLAGVQDAKKLMDKIERYKSKQ